MKGVVTRSGLWLRALMALGGAMALAGCSGMSLKSGPTLMPTPNVWAHGPEDPFAKVPPEFRTSTVDILVRNRPRAGRKERARPACTDSGARSRWLMG